MERRDRSRAGEPNKPQEKTPREQQVESFRGSLQAERFDGNAVYSQFMGLQSSVLAETGNPFDQWSSLAGYAGEAFQRASFMKDASTETFANLVETYNRTAQMFAPKNAEPGAISTPTDTTKNDMSGAKGKAKPASASAETPRRTTRKKNTPPAK